MARIAVIVVGLFVKGVCLRRRQYEVATRFQNSIGFLEKALRARNMLEYFR
jgi:hypothetical protein